LVIYIIKSFVFAPSNSLSRLAVPLLHIPQVLKELVDIGLKSYSSKNIIPTNNKSDKEADLRMKHTTYMLRMIAITSDVLRCVFDQSKVDGAHNNAEEQLAFIKNKVDHYIDGYLND